MRSTRWLLVAAGGLLAGWWLLGARAARERFANQVWIERVPRNERDMVWHFVPVEQRGKRLGAIGRGSRWRVVVDRFVWSRRGAQFEMRTPQNSCRSTLAVRSWECAGQAPRPFELCLELTGEGKTYRYYSRKDWVVKGDGELPGEIAHLVPSLLGTPPDAPDAPDHDQNEQGRDAPAGCPLLGP